MSRRRVLAGLMAATTIAAGVLTGTGHGQAQQDPSPATNQQAAQQNQPDRPQTPTFRAGVNYVRVDVVVTDKNGKPVSDLKPEDFEVTEAGKPQKIDTFKAVALDGGLMAARDDAPRAIRSDLVEEIEAARDDVRLFAILLDDYHVKRDSGVRVREQLARFVETQLGPSDMVGLMYPLEPIAAVRMTRDHDALRRGILQFEGRKHDYTPRNEGEGQYVFRVSPEQIERIRNQVSFGSIRSLIIHLGALKEGRKSLILVSEGYSNTLPHQMSAHGGLRPVGAGDTSNGSFPAVGGVAVPVGEELFQSMELNMELQALWDLANRHNVAIYTVDPRGLALSEFGMGSATVDRTTDRMYLTMTMDTLKMLAENSDGRAIINRNDMTLAMKQIVIDSSAYYLLGYNSNMPAPDGKFHEISVKVKRPGVEVRHRPGYWALTSADAIRMTTAPTPAAAPSSVEAALAATAVPRSRFMRTWIGAERGENGKTRVTFVWEPMPARVGVSDQASQQPARVMMTASGSDDSSYFRGRVPETAIPVGVSSAGARVTFEASPGTLQLRLSVEEAGGDVLDSEVRDFVVPDLTPARTLLGTPEVYRARTLPELQRLKSESRPMPTVARDFSRSERLLLRVPAYGPGGTTPAVTARLLNRAGQTMSNVAVAPPDGSRRSLQIEVSLASLSAGEYGISLIATGEGGEAGEFVAFRVTP